MEFGGSAATAGRILADRLARAPADLWPRSRLSVREISTKLQRICNWARGDERPVSKVLTAQM